MSSFLGGALPTNIIACDDERLLSDAFRQDVELADFAPVPGDLRSPWWPGGSGFIGDLAVDVALLESEASWGFFDTTRGSSQRYGVSGVTRDVYGSPLGGVTVKIYRTSTDEMVNSIVSDPSGNYFVTTPYYPDAHYIVTYKAGSPDTFGTTVNTLIGR